MLVGVSGFPPSLIPALRSIGILHHKKGKLPKHLQNSVYFLQGWRLFLFHGNPNYNYAAAHFT